LSSIVFESVLVEKVVPDGLKGFIVEAGAAFVAPDKYEKLPPRPWNEEWLRGCGSADAPPLRFDEEARSPPCPCAVEPNIGQLGAFMTLPRGSWDGAFPELSNMETSLVAELRTLAGLREESRGNPCDEFCPRPWTRFFSTSWNPPAAFDDAPPPLTGVEGTMFMNGCPRPPNIDLCAASNDGFMGGNSPPV
jgi:hypothetical protein